MSPGYGWSTYGREGGTDLGTFIKGESRMVAIVRDLGTAFCHRDRAVLRRHETGTFFFSVCLH
jgi:hypothetical protein